MGLDVYVGSLSRYYSGGWETVVQKVARETGATVVVVRPHAKASDEVDPTAVHNAAAAWRDGVIAALAPHVVAPNAWDETPSGPYFTDKPGWDGYWALRCWAAHQEHPEIPRAANELDPLEQNPAYLASTAEGYKTAYWHLLRDIELWLPIDFEFTFRLENLAGNQVEVGSSIALSRELDALNRLTWRAADSTLSEWRKDGPATDNTLESTARFGYAVIRELARDAVRHNLPMLLDY